MAHSALTESAPVAVPIRSGWARLRASRGWAGFWFMLPTALILGLFLAYPLLKGIWLSFTNARIGREGVFIGLENYACLYTAVASVVKFGVGLYLALLLNKNMPFKSIIRSIVLIPFVVPTVLSAIAFWWIFDSQ